TAPLDKRERPRGIEESIQPRSSAEYIVTEIKRHKKSVTIALATIVIAFGYGLYKFTGQRKPAAPIAATQVNRLTSNGRVWSALISPDGKHVLYTVDEAGKQSIWIREVATSSNAQIVPPSDATYANFTFTH